MNLEKEGVWLQMSSLQGDHQTAQFPQQKTAEWCLSFVEWILLHSSLLFPECQGNEINHCTAISSREAGLVSSTSEHIHSVSVSVCMFLFYIYI